MAKCGGCGRAFTHKRELTLVRDPAGAFCLRCDECQAREPFAAALESGAPAVSPAPVETAPPPAPSTAAANPPPTPPATPAAAGKAASPRPTPPATAPAASRAPGRSLPPGTARPGPIPPRGAPVSRGRTPPATADSRAGAEDLASLIESIQAATDILARPETVDEPTRSYKRAHERFATDLKITFFLTRDETPHQGRVMDLSRGGLGFITRKKLKNGQIIRFELGQNHKEGLRDLIKTAGEVMRVIERPGKLFEIGVRFVAHGLAQGANRRRFRRYHLDVPVYYQRAESVLTCRCVLADMSQNGICLIMDEIPAPGEILNLLLRTDGSQVAYVEIRGEARVVRIKNLDNGGCEAGGEFVTMNVRPLTDKGTR